MEPMTSTAKRIHAMRRFGSQVRDRDLGSTVQEAIAQINQEGTTAERLSPSNGRGNTESEKRAEASIAGDRSDHHPDHLHHSLHHVSCSAKWALLILVTVAMARVGGLLALLITGTFFSVASGVGFLALFGVSVQTGVIMLEYINQLRLVPGDIPSWTPRSKAPFSGFGPS